MKGNNFITVFSVLCAVGSICYGAGSRVSRAAQTPSTSPAPVYVANTTSQCVPTSIYHSIVLPTHPSNTAATPIFVRDIDNPGRTWWQQNFAFDLAQNMYNQDALYDVPVGYTLIVKGVSGDAGISSDTFSPALPDVVTLIAVGNGIPHGDWSTYFTGGQTPSQEIVANSPIYFLVRGGDSLTVYVGRSDVSMEATGDVTVCGELVKNS